jgi:hypothetical protein
VEACWGECAGCITRLARGQALVSRGRAPRPGASLAKRDFKFTYDGLDRLKQADRGVYNPAPPGTFTVQGLDQQWQ